MKTLIGIMVTALLSVSLSSTAQAQNEKMSDDMKGPMMSMLADPGERSMMMDHIAGNPEMRQEMMQKMMQTMGKSSEMDMHEMMSSPEMRTKMQKHVDMMQAMLATDPSDQAKMQEMMNNPEMKSMMDKHMMCSQMMNAGTTGEQADDKEEDHASHGGAN